jgi:Tripartite tricarboxylate transporter family receptor
MRMQTPPFSHAEFCRDCHAGACAPRLCRCMAEGQSHPRRRAVLRGQHHRHSRPRGCGRDLAAHRAVENRGGAGGKIGTAAVAVADPDGYTLLINASAHSAAPAAYLHLSYDAAKDFAAIAVFGAVPNVLTVSPSKGIKNVRELVERGKQGGLTYASAGVGSATHWAAERFLRAAGFKATHVPFRGGPEALGEVMAGRVDFCLLGMSSTIGLVRSGQLLPLAVSTMRRSPALPDVPTTTEAGFPHTDYTFWTDCSRRRRRRGQSSSACTRKSPRDYAIRAAGQIHAAERRSAAAQPEGLRCDDREGDRVQHRSGQSGRAEIQLSPGFGSRQPAAMIRRP